MLLVRQGSLKVVLDFPAAVKSTLNEFMFVFVSQAPKPISLSGFINCGCAIC